MASRVNIGKAYIAGRDPTIVGLRTFVAVADTGSVTRAARQLDVSQPSVTSRLQQLERSLSAELFHRVGRTLTLSAFGQALLGDAREIMRRTDALHALGSGHKKPDLPSFRIASIEPTASLRLPKITKQALQHHPEQTVRVTVLGAAGVERAVRSAEADVALGLTMRVAGWRYEPLFKEKLVALVAASDDLATRKSVSLKTLARRRLLLTDDSCAYRQAVEATLSSHNVTLARVDEISSIRTLAEAVAAGMGVAIAPKGIARTQAGNVREISLLEPITVPVGLIRPIVLDERSFAYAFVESAYDMRKRAV